MWEGGGIGGGDAIGWNGSVSDWVFRADPPPPPTPNSIYCPLSRGSRAVTPFRSRKEERMDSPEFSSSWGSCEVR